MNVDMAVGRNGLARQGWDKVSLSQEYDQALEQKCIESPVGGQNP